MQYGQIVFLLFIAFLFYYAVLIILDIQKAKMAQAAEQGNSNSHPKEPYHHPGYREAIMTDGILVDNLIEEINRLAETGTSDLGTVIFNCENAM